MSAADAVLAGRQAAEALMVDSCRITSGGEPTTDPDTGNVTTIRTTVYEGRCKVQSKDSATSNPEAGGASFTVGKVYRVEGFTPDSFDTAYRLPVKEIL